MSTNTVKTIHHTKLELSRVLGIPFVVDDFSTLNEKYNIGSSTPHVDSYPLMQYMTIGRGGLRNVAVGGGGTVVDILKHGVTDAVLFDAIPFIMVPVTADISPVERAKYRLRVLETYAGVDYYAYYVRVIDITSNTIESKIIEIENGTIISETPYTPSLASLNPVPIDISNVIANTVSGRHMVTNSIFGITLDSIDILNILDAVEIKYGDVRFATISEIGIVAGYDREITTTLGGNSVTYTEVDAAQILNFIGTEQPLQHRPTSITQQFGLTNTTPMPPVAP